MKKVLFIIGSPKTPKSNSYAISKYIEGQLGCKEITCSMVRTLELLNDSEKLTSTLNDLYDYNNIILLTPLYVDGLPAAVTEVIEKFSRVKKQRNTNPYFSVVVNCGFPEAIQTKECLMICKDFSEYMGFNWQRGIGIGMGEAIGGNSITNLGKPYDLIRIELDIFCADILNDKRVNELCFIEPYIPKKLFNKVGAFYWYRKAFKNRVLTKLNATPYLEKTKKINS